MIRLTSLSAGRQFDKHGNLKQWWNNRTIAAFREAAQCIVDQYSGYTMQEINLNINGRMTQGENIADNGGLKQAFRVCTGCPICSWTWVWLTRILSVPLSV